MKYLSLSIPGFGNIDSDLPKGVPVGGLFDSAGNPGTGVNAMQAFVILTIIVAILTTLVFILKGGWDMITSRGIKEKFHKGRDRVIYALFGLFMILISFLFLSAASAFFGTDLLPFLKYK